MRPATDSVGGLRPATAAFSHEIQKRRGSPLRRNIAQQPQPQLLLFSQQPQPLVRPMPLPPQQQNNRIRMMIHQQLFPPQPLSQPQPLPQPLPLIALPLPQQKNTIINKIMIQQHPFPSKQPIISNSFKK